SIEMLQTSSRRPFGQLFRKRSYDGRNMYPQGQNQRRPLHGDLLEQEGCAMFPEGVVPCAREDAGRGRSRPEAHVEIGEAATLGLQAANAERFSEVAPGGGRAAFPADVPRRGVARLGMKVVAEHHAAANWERR